MGPLRKLFACCVTGTADRKDTEDPYETDSQQPPTANPSAAAPATVSQDGYKHDPRHTAAPQGQQPGAWGPPQQSRTPQQGDGMHDAVPFSGPHRDQQQSTGVTVSSSTPQAVHAGHAQLDGGSPQLHKHFAPNATAGYMQQQQHPWPQHVPTSLYQHGTGLMLPHVLDPIAESPRPPPSTAADSPSRPHPAPVSLLDSPADLLAQAAGPTAAGVLSDVPAPGAAAAAAAATPAESSLPTLLLQKQEQQEQQQLGHPLKPAAAEVQPAASAVSPKAAAAAAAAAAPAVPDARRQSLESQMQYRQISLAQGLGDADVCWTPTAGAASQPDTPTMGLVEASSSQPLAAAAAADDDDDDGDAGWEAASSNAASSPHPQPAATVPPDAHGSRCSPSVGDGSPAVEPLQVQLQATPSAAAAARAAADGSSNTPPASPRRGLLTPFTQASAQKLVTQELVTQAKCSSSSNRNRGVPADGSNPSTSSSASFSPQDRHPPTQQHTQPPPTQQQHGQHKPLRERLSEDVEEAVVTQIRARRATSIATGSDPSRVWALVAQFDSSKQHAAAADAADAAAAAAAAAAPAGPPTGRRSTADGGVRELSPAAASGAAAADFTPANLLSQDPGILPQQQQLSQLSIPGRSAAGSLGGPAAAPAAAAAAYSSMSPPTSPHSTTWSVDSNASDVPLGLRKIKLGKTKAPKAEAALAAASAASVSAEHTGGSNIYSGSSGGPVLSGSSISSAAAAARDSAEFFSPQRQYPEDMNMNMGSAGDVGGFVPHFRPAPVAGAGSPGPQGMLREGGVSASAAAASAGKIRGLPPKPRSTNSLTGLTGTSSSSNSAGWATGHSSSSNLKQHSGPGLAGQGGQNAPGFVGQGSGEGLSGTGGTGLYSPPERLSGSHSFTSGLTGVNAGRVGSLQGGGDSWEPFMHYQQQGYLQRNLGRGGQGVGSGWSSESEGDGGPIRGDGSGEGRGSAEWEVLPVMPLSPLRVPRNKVHLNGTEGSDDTPPTPKTSVVGVSNSIIDYMLSEEGIPLVPTSGVDESAGVHGLDSPLLSGPMHPMFHSSSNIGRQQQLGQVSSWGGGGCTTPRFSHSGSFAAYGAGSRLSPSPGRVFGPSHSFAGHGAERLRQGLNQGPGYDRVGRRLPSAAGRGAGARRLSVGEEELRHGRLGMQGQQQQRAVRSLELRLPSSVRRSVESRPRGVSDPSEHSSSTGNAAAAGSGSREPPETPKRASYIGSGSLFGDTRPSQEESSRVFGDLQGPMSSSSHTLPQAAAADVCQALPVPQTQAAPETPKRASYIGSGSLFSDSRPGQQQDGSRFFGDLQGSAAAQADRTQQPFSADSSISQALPVTQGGGSSSSYAGSSGGASGPYRLAVLPFGQQALPSHSSTQDHQVPAPSAADLSFAMDGDSGFSLGVEQRQPQAVVPVVTTHAQTAGCISGSPGARSVGQLSDSPVSRLAAQARATAAAVAAVADSAASGSAVEGSSRLEAMGAANAGSSSSSFLSGLNNSSGYATSGSNLPSDAALFSRSGWAAIPQQQHAAAAGAAAQQVATSGSNLPSDAALFSRSGWAAMHQQQQQQQQPGSQEPQLQGQWSAGGRGGERDFGPVSLFGTP